MGKGRKNRATGAENSEREKGARGGALFSLLTFPSPKFLTSFLFERLEQAKMIAPANV